MISRMFGLFGHAAIAVLLATSASARDEPADLADAVAELRPIVERIESAETPPGEEEISRLRQAVTAIRAIIDANRQRAESEVGQPSPEAAAEARDLARRGASLLLRARVAELTPAFDAMAAEAPNLGDEDLGWIERTSEELQTDIARIQAIDPGSKGPVLDGVGRARVMIGALLVLELAARFERLRPSLEALQAQGAEAAWEDLVRADQSMERLRSGLKALESVQGPEPDPETVTATRALVRRLAIVTLTVSVEWVSPVLERLESSEAPPSEEERERYEALIDTLRFQIGEYENSRPEAEQAPPEIVGRAREVLNRLALYRLRVDSASLRSYVEVLESHEPPISPDDLKILRERAALVRESIRGVRGEEKEGPAVAKEGEPDEVRTARELLVRAEALVPPERIAPEEPKDSPESQPTLRVLRFYGSARLRYRFGAGKPELGSDTSWVGVRVKAPPWKALQAFARLEIATEPSDREQDGLPGGDPSLGDTNEDKSVFVRLGSVGVEGDWGWVSFGKQWSAYWDVAVFTDQLPVFSGVPTAALNAETDGGLSGTGRADDALQYRDAVGDVKLTAQVQIRNETSADPGWIDAYGFSTVWERPDGIDLGVAFNRVRDGLPDPGPGQPKENDTALLFGARYAGEDENWYAAATLSFLENHELDDLGRFYDGTGVEAYGEYDISRDFRVMADFSYLAPKPSHPGRYEFMAVTVGTRYRFFKNRFFVYLLAKADLGTRSDGTGSDDHRGAVLLHFNF